MDLSVVLLSYNTRDFTEGALRSVLDAARGLAVEVFVVDNASRDGSPELVAAKFPQVKLLRSERNLGFAGGNNLALRQVCGRYVMLLNTDTILRPDTLRRLVEFLDGHPEAGAAGCRILNPDGSLQLDSRRGFPTPLTALCKMTGLGRLFPRSPRLARYYMTYLNPDQVSEVEVLSGSCMVVRRQAMEQVGLLDEDYFMYGEDIDWCYRLHQAGWRIYYVPTTEIIHFRGESGRSAPLRILYHKSRAMSIFVNKHMKRRYRFFPVWLLQLTIVLYAFLKFALRLGRHLLLPFIDGLLVLLGLRLGLAVRYHPDVRPLMASIERLAASLGLHAQPTRWLAPPAYSEAQWLLVHAVPVLLALAVLYVLGLYDRRRYSPGWAALGVALSSVLVVTTVFFLKAYNFSRLAVAASWFFSTALVAGWRLAARWLLQSRRLGRRRTLVVGTDAAAQRLLTILGSLPQHPYEVVGVVGESPDKRGVLVAGRPVVGVVDELDRVVRTYGAEHLIFTADAVSFSVGRLQRRWTRRRLQVSMLPGSFAEAAAGEAPTSAADLPLIHITPHA
ncbi:MAG: glycosyltransferase [Candidatus Latescibacterota bacterium]